MSKMQVCPQLVPATHFEWPSFKTQKEKQIESVTSLKAQQAEFQAFLNSGAPIEFIQHADG